MKNGIKISEMLIICVLLTACGQSGPLYMPGQATGVHKKDVFLLNSDDAKAETPAVKDSMPDKTKPAANTAQTTPTQAEADTTVKTEQDTVCRGGPPCPPN